MLHARQPWKGVIAQSTESADTSEGAVSRVVHVFCAHVPTDPCVHAQVCGREPVGFYYKKSTKVDRDFSMY